MDPTQDVVSLNSGHRTDIDGLRAVAVLSVVLFHAGVKPLSGGYVGVDIFFVISGYLITGIIEREIVAGKFSIVAFYERRVRRIFPALFALFFVVAILSYLLLLPEALADLGRSLVSATLFVSNLFFYFSGDYFDAPSEFKPLLHTWSLAVEEQFYIVFPLYLWAGFRLLRSRVGLITFVLTLASLAISVWGVAHHRKAAFYLAPTRAFELLIGALVALEALPLLRDQRVRDLASLAGLTLIGWSVLNYSDDTPFPGLSALLPCAGTALVIHAGNRGHTIGGRILGTRPLVLVGLISYSLYLWHWPLLAFARYRAIRELRTTEVVEVVLAAVVASVISWRFVEQPFRRRDAVFRRRSLFSVASIGSAVFIAFGVWSYASNGIPARLGPKGKTLVALGQKNEPSCVERPSAKNIAATSCVIGSAQADTVRFAVWGDSHAGALFPVIDAVAKQKMIAGLFFGELGCPPILGVRKHEVGQTATDNSRCTEDSEKAFRAISKDAAIKHVILAARWSYYVFGTGYGMDRAHRVTVFAKDDTRRLTATEIERYAGDTVRALLSSGKVVYLLETVPEFSFSPDAMARMLWYGQDLQVLDEPRIAVEQRSLPVRELARHFEFEPHFHFVPTHDLFCTSLVCRFYKGSLTFYSDNNHVGPLANPLLAERIGSIFQE